MQRKFLPALAIGAALLYLGVSWVWFAALLIVGATVQWYLRRLVKRAGRRAVVALPDTIRLAGQHPAPWRHADQVRAAADELRAIGFEPAGEYTVPEMPGVLVAGFANTRESLYAAVCEHPAGIVWTDLSGEYADGTSVSASNAPLGDELDPMEGTLRIRERGASASTLLHRTHEAGKPLPLKSVEPALFKLTFERVYARDTAARKKRPLTNREADRFLAKVGSKAESEETTVGV
jgi:hypothetical protein